MLIEDGKRYVTRAGQVVGPATPQPQSAQWPWHIEGCGSYTNSGRFNGEHDNPLDLMGEADPNVVIMTGVPALDAAVKRLMVLDQESVFALVDIAEERVRQVNVEGWSPEHDNRHAAGEMAKAAAAYAIAPHTHKCATSVRPSFWPWGQEWWKPKSLHRNQVRAGALLVAELARHLRSAR